MIGETGERKSAVATPDGKSRKKKKKKLISGGSCDSDFGLSRSHRPRIALIIVFKWCLSLCYMHNYTFICFIFSGNGCTLLEMYFCLGVNKVLILVLVLVLYNWVI